MFNRYLVTCGPKSYSLLDLRQLMAYLAYILLDGYVDLYTGLHKDINFLNNLRDFYGFRGCRVSVRSKATYYFSNTHRFYTFPTLIKINHNMASI